MCLDETYISKKKKKKKGERVNPLKVFIDLNRTQVVITFRKAQAMVSRKNSGLEEKKLGK